MEICLASAILGQRVDLESYLPPYIPLQICFLMAVNVIGQRMNFMVILHGCWLVAILTRRRREAIARLWPNYCLFLTLFLLYQYLLCLGMPPALCIGKPQAEGLGVCGGTAPPDSYGSSILVKCVVCSEMAPALFRSCSQSGLLCSLVSFMKLLPSCDISGQPGWWLCHMPQRLNEPG